MNKESKYDNPEYLYMTYYIKNKLDNEELVAFDLGDINSTTPINYYDRIDSSSKQKFNIKNIYLVTNINKKKINNKTETNHQIYKTNLTKFNAYIIDYIKELDVSDKEKILIVEYNKIAKDDTLEDKKIYCKDINYSRKYCKEIQENNLYKTYIASLKW